MWAAIAATLTAAALAGWLQSGCYRHATDEARLDLRWWWVAPLITAACAAALTLSGSSMLLSDLVYVVGGVAIAVIDVDVHRLPDRFLSIWGALTGVALTVGVLTGSGGGRLIGAAGGAGALAVLYLLFAVIASMGMGDVKLAALTGAVLGAHSWQAICLGTIAAFAAAAIVAVLLLITRRGRRHDHLAFGPAIIAGAVAAIGLGGLS